MSNVLHDAKPGVVRVRPDEAMMTNQRLPYFVGICASTAGATGLSMYMVVVPPGSHAEPHYHADYETAIYMLEGKVETRYGPGLRESVITEAGDFLFIPPDVPHQPFNLDDTVAARAIVARNQPQEHERVVPYDPASA
ncbi:cupin domain-containing protein [Paraburkholderia dilworthii]|uniref:cupin domain-containing protein n=1 Tax=Paraburkholderia dilworthii TaxID=948106 RepID=UPI0003F76889|nr:cupin domain-containing protein [Paraburkholderia dilworthii]